MIHQLLQLTRPLFIFDCETTGVEPKVDRIIELGFQQWTAEGMIKEWRTLVNPEVPIPAVVTKVHGITNEMMRACQICGLDITTHIYNEWEDVKKLTGTLLEFHEFKPHFTFKQLAANLARGFSNCDYAGKNVRFDLRMIATEMQRAGQPWDYVGARIIEADRLEQLAVPRSLSHLHEKYTGAKHDGAHGALSDIRATATVIAKQLETYPNLPRDLDQLHEAQWPGWLCEGGEFRMINGVATCQFGKHRGVAMKDIPVAYYDWILGTDFPADVKALARAAKLGQFPGEHP